MKLLIDTKSVKIMEEEKITSGGFNDSILDVEFSDEYKSLTTFITFNNAKRMVIGNKVNIPTLEDGICEIGAYGIKTVNDETVLRYSPQPAYINIKRGSYNDDLHDPLIPTQTEYENMLAIINKAIEEGKMKGDKGDVGEKGEKGEKGDRGDITNIITKNLTSFWAYDNYEYRLGNVSSNIIVNFPASIPNNYFSSFIFTTGETNISIFLAYSLNPKLSKDNIIMIGEDCENDVFTPLNNKHYTVVFMWDEEYMIGRVEGFEV